jgi:hypothetical protein
MQHSFISFGWREARVSEFTVVVQCLVSGEAPREKQTKAETSQTRRSDLDATLSKAPVGMTLLV